MDMSLGLKELYQVSLKTTFPIEMNGRTIEVGETIAAFDKIQVAGFEEIKSRVSAKGGYDNRSLIWWEESKEVDIVLSQGVFSKDQFAIMTGAKLIADNGASTLLINQREAIEANEKGIATTKFPILEPVFVYDKNTGEKITNFGVSGNTVFIGSSYRDIIVDYYYNYDRNYNTLMVGRNLTNGYLSLEGKMRVKDDTTGQITTGIVKIPKLKLLSNLSMRLGQDAIPVTGRMNAVAAPTGERGHKKVMEIIFLSDDIDSDM